MRSKVFEVLKHIFFNIFGLGLMVLCLTFLFRGLNLVGFFNRTEFENQVEKLEMTNQIEKFGFYNKDLVTIDISQLDGYEDYIKSEGQIELHQLCWIIPFSVISGVYLYGVFRLYFDGD